MIERVERVPVQGGRARRVRIAAALAWEGSLAKHVGATSTSASPASARDARGRPRSVPADLEHSPAAHARESAIVVEVTRPNELSRALRKRGCAIWPRAFGFSALERVGEPPPCDEAGAQSASGVAIGGNGLNSYAPLQEAEEITPILDRPDVLAVLETVVGAGGRVEALSGNLSDESRRFYDWRLCDRCNRVGGPGAMGGRARGSRPPRVHPRRTFAEAPE